MASPSLWHHRTRPPKAALQVQYDDYYHASDHRGYVRSTRGSSVGRHDRAHSERPVTVSANLGPASTSSTLVKSKIKSRTYSDSQEQQPGGDDPPAPGVQAAKLELYRPTTTANGASSLNTSTRLRTSDFYTLHSSSTNSPLTASKSYSKLSSFTTSYHRAS